MVPAEAPPGYDMNPPVLNFGGDGPAKVEPVLLERAVYKYDAPGTAACGPVASSHWLRQPQIAPGSFQYSHSAQINVQSVLQRFPAMNGVSMFSEKDPIIGECETYPSRKPLTMMLPGTHVIDPLLPTTQSSNMFVNKNVVKEERMQMRAEREHAREADRAENGWSVDWVIKNVNRRNLCAAVRTRKGDISLDLYITAAIGEAYAQQHQAVRTPTPVSVSSRHGDISLNVVRLNQSAGYLVRLHSPFSRPTSIPAVASPST